MVEHAAHNRGVVGSIPTATTSLPTGRLLAAVSGGPDSTALLVALVEAGRQVVAAHFDHDLRPASREDAEWVQALADRLGVRLVAGKRTRALASGSRQAAARQLRYEFLAATAAAERAAHVVLAHTADDLVEGALLHLLRGSGLAGLRGMPDRRGLYMRPFLDTWRTEIEGYLRQRAIEPRRDPSNDDQTYARVYVRKELLPALERACPGLTQTIHRAARAAARYQDELEHRAAKLTNLKHALQAAEPAVRKERYRQLFQESGGTLPALSRVQLDQMDRLTLSGRPGQSLHLPQHRTFRVEHETIAITREFKTWPKDGPSVKGAPSA